MSAGEFPSYQFVPDAYPYRPSADMAQPSEDRNLVSPNPPAAGAPLYFPSTDPVQPSQCLTDAKIKRAVLYLFATLAVAGSAALISLSAMGFIAWPFALISIPLFAATFGFVAWARNILDYDNPKELAQMQKDAATRSFSEILRKHKLGKIKDHKVVSVEELRRKFFDELLEVGMRGFYWGNYPVLALKTCGYLDDNQYRDLCGFRQNLTTANNAMHRAKVEAAQAHPRRQEVLLREIEGKKQEARRTAAREKAAVRDVGYSATYAATALQHDPRKTPQENCNNRQTALLTGMALTGLVGAVNDMSVDRSLDMKLAELDRRKDGISRNQTSLTEQNAYDKKIREAEATYNQEARRLQKAFTAFLQAQFSPPLASTPD
jgi:hypothetical protein